MNFCKGRLIRRESTLRNLEKGLIVREGKCKVIGPNLIRKKTKKKN